jgi:hypothetical protein
MKTSPATLPSLVLLITLAQAAHASNVWIVNGMNGNDSNNCRSPQTACKTIGHAISLATSSDSIIVAPAIYTENLTINVSLTMIGAGATRTIIDGGGVNRVISIPPQTAKVTLWGLTIRNGVPQAQDREKFGSGVLNFGTLTINRCTITNNHATGFGGFGAGIFSEGNLTINDSTISQNGHVFGGGGIYSTGRLTINNSTIAANSAGIGGGIENRYTQNGGSILTIKNSTITSNTALNGGGILNQGSLVIVNSTLNGNTALDENGGAITNDGTLAVFNATFAGNSAVKGGAIFNGGAATLQNSIVANSTKGGNCSGIITSHGYNLSSDATCNFSIAGDLNNVDPMLGPLKDHGGPTQTLAVQSGSPAIDAGNPSGCTDEAGHLLKTDQRGAPRPDKEDVGGCDIGAYERQTD